MKPDPARLQLGNYPFTVELQTRFGDLDPHNHINNVAIMQLFEESRLRFALFAREGDLATLAKQTRIVAANVEFKFLREVHFPDAVTVGVGIKHIGNSSYQLGCAMFQKGNCMALSEAVLVCSDGERSQPLPDYVKAQIGRYPIQNLASAS